MFGDKIINTNWSHFEKDIGQTPLLTFIIENREPFITGHRNVTRGLKDREGNFVFSATF